MARSEKSEVNCRKCDDGPKDRVTTGEAINWADKHGQEAHGQSTVGLNWNMRSAK